HCRICSRTERTASIGKTVDSCRAVRIQSREVRRVEGKHSARGTGSRSWVALISQGAQAQAFGWDQPVLVRVLAGPPAFIGGKKEQAISPYRTAHRDAEGVAHEVRGDVLPTRLELRVLPEPVVGFSQT